MFVAVWVVVHDFHVRPFFGILVALLIPFNDPAVVLVAIIRILILCPLGWAKVAARSRTRHLEQFVFFLDVRPSDHYPGGIGDHDFFVFVVDLFHLASARLGFLAVGVVSFMGRRQA